MRWRSVPSRKLQHRRTAVQARPASHPTSPTTSTNNSASLCDQKNGIQCVGVLSPQGSFNIEGRPSKQGRPRIRRHPRRAQTIRQACVIRKMEFNALAFCPLKEASTSKDGRPSKAGLASDVTHDEHKQFGKLV